MMQNSKKYDLEDRTFIFAAKVRDYVKRLTKTITNIEYSKQLIRSSGSVAANYIEANESISRKDYYLRVKICRKEAKESKLWLSLSEIQNIDSLEKERIRLINESIELTRIFGSILTKNKTIV
jgi:four helix bundle protein